MDKLAKYRTIIKQILTSYLEVVNRTPEPKEIDTDVVFDEERDHYMLVNVGWFRQERWRGTTVYLRLRQGKIWVEEDWLEDGIVKDLVAAGVPREDIVLGFQSPEVRPYTDFATT
ncbi:MAG: XisI protein [Desulfobacterales bacterium]|nr:XisI protein [Desulfobacterales bacterium]